MTDQDHTKRRRALPATAELRGLYEAGVGSKCMSCGSAEGRARTFAASVPEDDLSNLIVLCDGCDESRRDYSPVDPEFLSLIVAKTRRERAALGRPLDPRNSRRVLDYLRMRAG